MSAGQAQELEVRQSRVVTELDQIVTTSGGDGGAPSKRRAGAVEIWLSDDSRMKTALHALILILPIAVLIFWQALQHPSLEIELPIIKLKLQIKDLLPVLLLLISYMLHRAVRYTRIVLWNVWQSPDQMGEVARIALDDAEAYKINSAHYQDVLDSMTADLSKRLNKLGREWLRKVTWFSFESFNVIMSIAIYSIIFLMLVVMCLYVSSELLSLASSQDLVHVKPSWPIDPAHVIGVLVFGLASLLLFLAWLNAAITVLTALWVICVLVAVPVFRAIGVVWRTPLFEPTRSVLRDLCEIAAEMREKHRDRLFERDKAAYSARKGAPEGRRVARGDCGGAGQDRRPVSGCDDPVMTA